MTLFFLFFGFILVCCLALFGITHFFDQKEKQKILRQYQIISDDFFDDHPTPYLFKKGVSLKGKIKGMPIQLETLIHNKNKFKSLKSSFAIPLSFTSKASFFITREHFLAKLEKLIGKQDIEIGMDNFDDYFLIRGSSEAFAKKILNKDLQEILLESHPDIDGTFKIQNNQLSYHENNAISNSYHRKRFLDLLKVGAAFYKRINEMETENKQGFSS